MKHLAVFTIGLNILLILLGLSLAPNFTPVFRRYHHSQTYELAENATIGSKPSAMAQDVTPIPRKTVRANPTRTPKPTPIPPEIPPPTDRRLLQSMILFCVLAVLVVIFGVWINRDRLNMR